MFNDLQPYICLLENCKTPDRLFARRRDWEDHLSQESDTLFDRNVCPLCFVVLPSARNWRSHVGREMQQMALFAIPKEIYGEGDEEDDEGENEGVASSESTSVRPEEDLVDEMEAIR